ncbi:hypothetical protein JYT61_00445 [bacterium AH-315-E10]|nr:hypothetical protein [bacterium AH-315-E10]
MFCTFADKADDKMAIETAISAAQAQPKSTKALKKLYVLIPEISDTVYKEALMGAVCTGLHALKQEGHANKLYAKIINHNPGSRFIEELSSDGLKSVCKRCKGRKVSSTECRKCKGKKSCTNTRCRKGKVHMERLNKPPKIVTCSNCKGTAKCPACKGEGQVASACMSCYGKGRRVSSSELRSRYMTLLSELTETLETGHIKKRAVVESKPKKDVRVEPKREAVTAVVKREEKQVNERIVRVIDRQVTVARKLTDPEIMDVLGKEKTPEKFINVLKETAAWFKSQQRRIGGSVVSRMEAHIVKSEAVLFLTVKPLFLKQKKSVQTDIVEGIGQFWNLKTSETRSIRRRGKVVVINEDRQFVMETNARNIVEKL